MAGRDPGFDDGDTAASGDSGGAGAEDGAFHREVYDDWQDAGARRGARNDPDEPDYEVHSHGLDFGLLLLRLGGLALLPHGVVKAADMEAFVARVDSNLVGGQAPELFAWLIMLGMVGLPILVAVGLFTRPAGFLLAGMMASIFALAVLPRLDYRPFQEAGGLTGESALLFVALSLPLAFTGGGRWSLDAMRTAGRP